MTTPSCYKCQSGWCQEHLSPKSGASLPEWCEHASPTTLYEALADAVADKESAIRAAVEEATSEALKVRDHDVKIVVDNSFKMQADAFAEGKRDAYEDAAKIAEAHKGFATPEYIRMRAKEVK